MSILYIAKLALVRVVMLVTMAKMSNLNPALWERKVASMEKLQVC
jgi:hypothetical protein